jgi:hypothetical protein
MSSLKSRLAVLAVGLSVVGASGAQASDLAAAKSGIDQAMIDKSTLIQTELARIDGDKEAFVDALLSGWVPYVDASVFDVVSEYKPIAMKAPAWRLYGASLVGNFGTMVRVLRGQEPAGPHINRLDKAEPKVRHDSKVLGDFTNSLVYTPIRPCRIVDTRGTGARTGIMAPGVARIFDLTTQGLTEGQGGDTVCPDVPSFSHFGWDANITATQHTADGGLQVWGFTGPVPSTSLLNFFATGYAVANNGAITGCDGCTDDIVISAFGSPAHVIVDLMGFYERATGFGTATGAVVVTALGGTNTSIPANTSQFISGAACPAGTVVVSGGMSNSSSVGVITSDHTINGTSWREYLRNGTAAAVTATVFSHCIDVN